MQPFHRIQKTAGDAPPMPIVFLPGWGFDAAILELAPEFERSHLPWILPGGPIDPATACEDLATFLQDQQIPRVDLVGWSMGACLALEFANRFPNRTSRLILLAAREQWPAAEIDHMRAELASRPADCLKHFYRRCFLGQREAYHSFVTRYESRYLDCMNADQLDRGLAYLASFTMPTTKHGKELLVMHGDRDMVAPLKEMARFSGAQEVALPHMGHALFLAPEFWATVADGKKNTIRKRFTDAASTYDQHAALQKTTGHLLAQKIPTALSPRNILEIGCGTGNYTRQLATRWPHARILALDFAPDMLDQARIKLGGEGQVSFLCADGERYLAEADERFDLITSNACMQWFEDPESAFAHMARLLPPGGYMACSLFGPASLKELDEALTAEWGHHIPLAAGSFPGLETLQAWLKTDFTHVEGDELLLPREYQSVLDLLSHLKKTGTSGMQTPPVFTRARLRRLDQWFAQRLGGCRLSYQVFLLLAQKPAEP